MILFAYNALKIVMYAKMDKVAINVLLIILMIQTLDAFYHGMLAYQDNFLMNKISFYIIYLII